MDPNDVLAMATGDVSGVIDGNNDDDNEDAMRLNDDTYTGLQ